MFFRRPANDEEVSGPGARSAGPPGAGALFPLDRGGKVGENVVGDAVGVALVPGFQGWIFPVNAVTSIRTTAMAATRLSSNAKAWPV